MIELRNGVALKKLVLGLPVADWESPGWWRSLLIVPTPQRQDSGYSHIAIIGVNDNAEKILAYPDDIQFPAFSNTPGSSYTYGALRMDSYWPSGVLRLWSRDYEFSVDGISSVEIVIRKKETK